jgi:hypothetical protein
MTNPGRNAFRLCGVGALLSALAGCSDPTRVRLLPGTPETVSNEKLPFAIMLREDGRRKTMVQVPVWTHAVVVSDNADAEGPDRAVRVAIKKGEHPGEGQVGRRYLKQSPEG